MKLCHFSRSIFRFVSLGLFSKVLIVRLARSVASLFLSSFMLFSMLLFREIRSGVILPPLSLLALFSLEMR